MVLLDLMGGVALLLWGLHMVHSGILRAFGPDLRLLLAKALNNRFTAFAAGIGLTALLQSSTATALITSSFTVGRPGQPGAGARDHARRQCRHHADRADAVVQHRRGRAGPVHHRPGRLPQRAAFADQGHRPRLDRPRPDAAGAAHPARHAGAGGERARRARLHERHHRRSRALHHHRRRRHLGGAFQRRQRAAGHVAGLCAFHFALCGAGAGARRQSRQRDQSDVRRRAPRQSRELSAAARQSRQPAGRRAAGRAVPASDRRSCCRPGSPISPRRPRCSTSPSTSRPRSSSSACSTAWRGC